MSRAGKGTGHSGGLAGRALGGVREAWAALWFAPDSPYPLAAFRIMLGAYLLAYFGSLAPHTTVLFSREGVYVPYLVPDCEPSPLMAACAMSLLMIGCLALTVGLYTRAAAVLVLALFGYHYLLALGVKHSTYERLIGIYLLALLPGRAGEVWSVDAWLRRLRGHSAGPRSTWSFCARVLRFQTIVLYLGAGLWKLGNPEWHAPHLLRSTLRSVWATPLGFDIVQLGLSDATFTRISLGVIAFELLLAGLLFFKRTRPAGVGLGVAFHLVNTFVLYLPEFLVCLTAYVFFLEPSRVERLGRALGSVAGLSPRSRAGG